MHTFAESAESKWERDRKMERALETEVANGWSSASWPQDYLEFSES